MSEIMELDAERLCNLKQFAFGLMDDEDGKTIFDENEPYILSVTALEAIHVFEYLLSQHVTIEKAKITIGKLFNVFYKPLTALHWDKPGEEHLVHYLMLENREAEKIMDNMKAIIKKLESNSPDYHLQIDQLQQEAEQLKAYELHYSKEENILFSFLDSVIDQHKYLLLMQLLHNDFRTSLTNAADLINSKTSEKEIIAAFGKLFFVLFPLIFFEEHIIFPIAFHKIEENEWPEMLRQSMEIGWCFGIKPEMSEISAALEKK